MIIKNNKVYDCLKWLTCLGIPAVATCISQLAPIFGWEWGGEVCEVSAIVCTCLGTLLGISNYQYYKQNPTALEAFYDLEDMEVEEGQNDEEGEG